MDVRDKLYKALGNERTANAIKSGTAHKEGRSLIVRVTDVMDVVRTCFTMSLKGLHLAASLTLFIALGMRNMNVAEAAWGYCDIYQMGYGGAPVWNLSSKRSPWVLRLGTCRKMDKDDAQTALREFIHHKNPLLCPILALSILRFHLLFIKKSVPLPTLGNWLEAEMAQAPDGKQYVKGGPAYHLPLVGQLSCPQRHGALDGQFLKQVADLATGVSDTVASGICWKAVRNFVGATVSQDASASSSDQRGRLSHEQHTKAYATTDRSLVMITGGYKGGLATERQCASHRILGRYLPGDASAPQSEQMLDDALAMQTCLFTHFGMHEEWLRVHQLVETPGESEYKSNARALGEALGILAFLLTSLIVLSTARPRDADGGIDMNAPAMRAIIPELQELVAPLIGTPEYGRLEDAMRRAEER